VRGFVPSPRLRGETKEQYLMRRQLYVLEGIEQNTERRPSLLSRICPRNGRAWALVFLFFSLACGANYAITRLAIARTTFYIANGQKP